MGFPASRRKTYKISGLDKTRSFIESIKSYPLNVEMRHVKTYNSSEPPSNASTGSISLEMNNSMILLPKEQMKRRYFDQRVGGLHVVKWTMVLMFRKVKPFDTSTVGDWKLRQKTLKNLSVVNCRARQAHSV